ncbi:MULTISPECIES: PLDc N-terminal domain-containing protein [Paenibacillus]|uniref:Transcriptional regulator n=1 Tax=Paenibacillus odorifer TaxID=189426 RepID=A0A1R0ZDC1_9BACL|nr:MULTISPECIES: PLD nuclease N-terminal domain-containing protein [Paenibacillus]MBY3623081.1 PLDc_N domain-containing protein [Acinetobacter sp. CUI P1]AIQ26033.1 Negative regulatory protein YxlE [Paenibacillus sp. FSL H7-0737]OMD47149.1 transcriptional regulator [Paenibacillus odorifer]OME67594.1 transcriptional regulator [Paenibacillus odorifer]WHY18759.1 PLD nuclease N-terminal domain-containing protein [Paenibacillus sp. G2S3]
MEDVNWGLIMPLIILQALLAIIGLISLAKADRVRGPKWMWIIIIIFGNILGSVAYFTIGRKDV